MAGAAPSPLEPPQTPRKNAPLACIESPELGVALTCALAAAMVGASGIVAYHAGWPLLLTWHARFSALHYNTAVLLLLGGVSLAAVIAGKRMLGGGLAFLLMVFAAALAANELLALHLSLNSALFPMGTGHGAVAATRVAPNTAAALLAAGLGIFFAALPRRFRWRGAASSAGGTIVSVIAAVSLFGYAFSVSPAYRWREYTPMSLPSTVALALLGLGILTAGRWQMRRDQLSGLSLLSTTVAIVLTTVSLLLWQALDWQRDQAQPQNALPEVALAIALVMSGLALLSLFLAQVARRRSRDVEASGRQLARLNRDLRAITDCNQALVHASDEQQLLEQICAILVEQCGYRLAWVGYAEKNLSVRAMALAGAAKEFPASAGVTWSEAGEGPVGKAIRSGRMQSCADLLTCACAEHFRDQVKKWDLHSALAIPLYDGPRCFGALSLYAGEPGAFDATEMKLMRELADDLSYGICALRSRQERERARRELQLSEERYRCLTAASAQVVWTTDARGLMLDEMPSWTEFTGKSRDQYQGWGWLDDIHPDDRQRAAEVWGHAIAARSFYETEYRLRNKDGEYRHVWVRGVPLIASDGSIREWVGTCTDITERKQAEEQRQRYAVELERSNAELQDFASVASHDLQEPLRKVLAFGDRLREHSGPSLDETGQDYLRRMQGAAGRMSQLIESLLQYSRVTSRAKPFERVDLAQVMFEVVGDLEERLRESGALLRWEVPPIITADRTQMRQLLQNLLANALKFQPPGQKPEIYLSARKTEGGEWEICIRDNGIGFDPEYAERIFRPFQRLHGRQEYAGSGMGLAICRKIALRHAGTLLARSAPGAGSTFVLTLPAPTEERSQPWSADKNASSSSPKTMTTTTC